MLVSIMHIHANVRYLDLDEVENDGHVIDFYVSDVAMTTGFVVLMCDLVLESLLQLQQNLPVDKRREK